MLMLTLSRKTYGFLTPFDAMAIPVPLLKVPVRGSIGNRGLGATTNILIGSVAEKVIHLSPLPVLLAGQSNH